MGIDKTSKPTSKKPAKQPPFSPRSRQSTSVPQQADIHRIWSVDTVTPERVLALQRTYGNRFVQRLVADAPPAVQRTITTLRRKTAKNMLSTFKMSKSTYYEEAIKYGLKDQDIIDKFQALIEREDVYTYTEAEQIVAAQILDDINPVSKTNREKILDGLKVTIANHSEKVDIGQVIEANGNTYKVHSKWLRIDTNLLISGTDTEVEKWDIGFIQTVTGSERSIYYIDKEGNKRLQMLTLPDAKRDGGSDILIPWFQDKAMRSFGKKGLLQAEVSFEDRPGFGIDLLENEMLDRLCWRDAFKLVLAMRRKDGTAIHYLHTWIWHADYDNSKDEGELGIVVSTNVDGGDGSDLVFDGPRARNSFDTTDNPL